MDYDKTRKEEVWARFASAALHHGYTATAVAATADAMLEAFLKRFPAELAPWHTTNKTGGTK